ncbi:DUF6221 family protein [Nocardiopsis synnemataformans]|uniref:DUF6221 family protein n=1 Tax=Nocardiopsis synnemataformans TaxID=61305 RepID=UPI003EB8AF50
MTIVEFINARLDEDENLIEFGARAHVAMEPFSGRHLWKEIEARRAILADALAEKHAVVEDSWYTCPAATEERDGGECGNDDLADAPCECGRDNRVGRLLSRLAFVYADHSDYEEGWKP